MKSKLLHYAAFSLVELSIVLVILGLLVGGILSGQALIKGAAMRSYIKQHDQYYTAAMNFRDKYFGLPGDITNATSFWGQAAAPLACLNTASTDARTCNGDGDGQLYVSASSYEYMRAWQQMANAGLIEGKYDGVNNSPISKLNTTKTVNYYYFGSIPAGTQQVQGDYGNTYYTADGLRPEDAWNVDTKLDDGKPMMGKLVAYELGGPYPTGQCSTAANSADYAATYRLTVTTEYCQLLWRNEF